MVEGRWTEISKNASELIGDLTPEEIASTTQALHFLAMTNREASVGITHQIGEAALSAFEKGQSGLDLTRIRPDLLVSAYFFSRYLRENLMEPSFSDGNIQIMRRTGGV